MMACRVVLVLGLASGLGSCGGDSESEQPAVCGAVDRLKASVEDLQSVKIERGALPDLSAELRDIQADVRLLGDDASAEYADEIDAVKAHAADLEVSLNAASAAPTAPTVSAVGADIRALGGSFRDLTTAVGTTC